MPTKAHVLKVYCSYYLTARCWTFAVCNILVTFLLGLFTAQNVLLSIVFLITWTFLLDESTFLMVVRESVIFGIPLDPNDPSNNAMTPVSGISQGQDIDFDDQEELVYWVQNTVSPVLYFMCFINVVLIVQ